MIETLKRFTEGSLFEASSYLLNKLNIGFEGETAQPIDVADIYDGPMPQYLTEALKLIKDTYFIGVANDLLLSGSTSSDSLSEISETIENGGKYDGMFVFACDTKDGERLSRTQASALTRAFNRISCANPVILVIREGDKVSLATCERMNYTQEWRRETGEKLGKVSILRNVNCTHPHRGHVDILDSLSSKVCKTFDELYQHWMEVFSSELLTKKFYNELSDWYAWAVQVAKFPNDLASNADDAKYNHEACIRLITRLIFAWFLKQKNLIPEEFFDEKYIRENLIENFNPHDEHSSVYDTSKSKYYRLILQNLFFAMLNCPIATEEKVNNRCFRKGTKSKSSDANNLMRYEAEFTETGAKKFLKLANSSVPFLNGGLFDCLDDKTRGIYYDGFSERKESLEQLFIPDYLFFGEEAGAGIDLSQWYGDKKKKKVSARGIIDILKRYSFTIEENTPYDQEVSLDPELLGKVFENLLAAYNPETQESARRQTGSFYTPRQIVQYMVDESLVAHLIRTCGQEMEPQYRALLSYASDDPVLTEDQCKKIMHALYNCRVLDPACGSGAFPMGVLQQMVHVLKRIDPTNEMWNTMMVDIAIEDARKELLKVASGTDEEKQKIEDNRKARLEDIENAFNTSINDPDYARKLYLIERCIYGVDIQPIATQISKLRFFISLVVDQNKLGDPKSNFGIRPLPNLESKFVTANTLIPLKRGKTVFTYIDEVQDYEDQLQELNHKIFLAKKISVKSELKERMCSVRRMMAQMLENRNIVDQEGASQLIDWDMFDQNASAKFFDSEWMFGVKGGFDIVIANPPYFQIRKNVYPKDQFPYSEGKDKGKQNMYKLFTEFGYNACKTDGVVCMIVQSSLMCDVSASHTRELLLRKTCIDKFIEFPKVAPTRGGQVFANVCQGTCIFLFQKSTPKGHKFNLSVNNDCTTISDIRWETIDQDDLITYYPKDYAIPVLRPGEFDILKKIKNNKTLSSYILSAVQGDLNLTNDRSHFSSSVTPVALLRGRHIARYSLSDSVDEYVDINFKSNVVKENQENIFLVCQQITGTVDSRRIHCAVTDPSKTFLLGNSINKLKVKDKDYIFYLLAILNSKLMDWVFRKTSTNNHVNCYELEQLPIATPRYLKMINNKVDKLLKGDSDDQNCSYNKDLDNIVYHLYGLSYDEVIMIDPDFLIPKSEYEAFIEE